MYIQQINTIYILHIKYLYIQMKFEIIHVSYLILRNLLDSFILFIGKQINIKFLKFLRLIKNIYIYIKLTAGSAKKDIANTLKHEATIFPIHVCGTVSPYPIVVTVI